MRRNFPTYAFGGGVGLDYEPPAAASTPPPISVALLGHSYVRNLFRGPYLVKEPYVFHNLGVRGATLDNIEGSEAWERLQILFPSLTIILIGGNDINPTTQPRELATRIQALAQRVEEVTGSRVLICTIEVRLRPRGVSHQQFNAVKNATNRWLRRVLPYTKARCHPCGVKADHIGLDGIHLNEVGLARMMDTMFAMTRDCLSQNQL